jgi:hypothetical protein
MRGAIDMRVGVFYFPADNGGGWNDEYAPLAAA